MKVGDRYRERDSGRIARIVAIEVHGTGPAYEYEDDGSWHYCDIADFVLWDRWERMTRPENAAGWRM